MLAQIIGQKRLFMTHFAADFFKIIFKIFQQMRIGVISDLKAIHRAIADHAPRFFPIADDHHAVIVLSLMGKKAVNIINDDNVNVQKQRRTL